MNLCGERAGANEVSLHDPHKRFIFASRTTKHPTELVFSSEIPLWTRKKSYRIQVTARRSDSRHQTAPKARAICTAIGGVQGDFTFDMSLDDWDEESTSSETSDDVASTPENEEDLDLNQEETTILGWYDASRPRMIDLVGDYAGKELFLVEGDSLLRECFEDERIDFNGILPVPHHKHQSYAMCSLQQSRAD